ncbi:Tyrosine-protein kinase Fes/Fps, partial [Lemmus lemmus]
RKLVIRNWAEWILGLSWSAAACPRSSCPQVTAKDTNMGFSSELCSPQGHGAVQQMQEAELRLLEGMRKWMAQRIKSDREYAGLLHHMSLQDGGGQNWSSGPDSHVSQSWAEITSQTENLSRVLRQHAEDLNSGPLSKLSVLIRERQHLRKTYNEQWQQLQQELTKTHSQDIEKLKSQYRSLVRDSAQARRKYQEASKDKDRDKAKDKYVRSLWKLFAHHNRYVLGVRAAQLHHLHYHQFMLPGLLQSLQDLHEEMAGILKDILQEYLEISSLVQDDVASIHRELAAAAARIQPELEYLGFLRQYGSTPDVPPCVTFDESLLEEGEQLEPGELQLNELTLESVQHTLTSVTDELAAATKEVLSRQEMVSQLQNELRNEEQITHPRERVQLLGKRQVLQEAMQGLQVALCSQDKLQAQQELLKNKMEQLGTGEPPAVLLLQDDRHSTSSAPDHPLTSVPGLRSRSERGEGHPHWRSLKATSLESSAPSSLSLRHCSSFPRCRSPSMSSCGTMGPSLEQRWLSCSHTRGTSWFGKARASRSTCSPCCGMANPGTSSSSPQTTCTGWKGMAFPASLCSSTTCCPPSSPLPRKVVLSCTGRCPRTSGC